ncbi:Lrp/AsnC family transcriptional regulator [Kribbella turkmenica]|uniref:Lrp/AsnC family transcriptional regulator n=1 Tax=Kribbella turkmenica TaxID=2530375 RepID=UPI00192D3143|nr:Lrp/AsnC family transcriptional regulator [Kribbella turkmenica]
MAGYVTLDAIDRGLVHALRVDGRVAFSGVAEVLGVSEHTVARRYRRLRASGVLRVVAVADGVRLGKRLWIIRIRCALDVSGVMAAAVAGRPDTYWVQILSGGTEVCGHVSSNDQVLVEELPWDRGVLGVSAHEVLPGPFEPPRWGPGDALDAEQVARLRRPAAEPTDQRAVLDARDRRLLDGLNRDGRATYAELGKLTGWSQSTVARRLDHLRRTGVLTFHVEVPPEALGHQVEARLWMVVQPGALVTTAEALTAHPEISYVAVTTGLTNLVAQVICPDSAHLYRYLTEQVGSLAGVNTLETAPVLRTAKGFYSRGPDG